jgi:hypothetical protein
VKELKVGAVEAVFRSVELDFGLVVESFEIRGSGATVDLKSGGLQLPSPGHAKAVVTEGAIQALLTKQAPAQVRDFSVQVSGGLIYVEAKAQVVVTIPVKAVCTIEIRDGKRLEVVLKQADVLGGAAKNLIESQLDKINPIFDVADLPIEVNLLSVEADGGRVVVLGDVVGVRR